MMNAFFNEKNWKNIEYVGFDLDGTLYDEYEFIYQVYSEINKKFLHNQKALEFMLRRWMEKGSSYPYIFEETYLSFIKKEEGLEDFLKNTLKIYRNFYPKLHLAARTKFLLEYFGNNYCLFLITDGNCSLQKNKYNALGLFDYFSKENTVFTGCYGSNYVKPNSEVIHLIEHIDPKRSIFFGDRDIDEKFAERTNMRFVKVYNMVEIR